MATLLSLMWLLMPHIKTRVPAGFQWGAGACFLEVQNLENNRINKKKEPMVQLDKVSFALRLKVGSCCSRGDSCGRTLFTCSCSAAGELGHVWLEMGIGLHRAQLAGLRAPLPAPGLIWAVVEQAPMWHPGTPCPPQQHVPAWPHISASAATRAPSGAGSRRRERADRQTDRQAPAGYPGFIAKLSSVGSSSSADAGSLCPKPSLLKHRGCQEGLRLHRGRSTRYQAAPSVGWL